MTKKISILLTFVFIFVLSFSGGNTVDAQTTKTEVQTQINKICLKGAGAGDQSKTVYVVPTANMTFDLTGSGFVNTYTVYVALCLPSPKKSVCSTGNAAYDKEIFGADYTKDLQNLDADAGTWNGYNYGARNTGALGLTIAKNKLIPENGTITATATLTGAQGHFVYPFYGFYREPAAFTQPAGVGGNQQSTFPFDALDKNCTSILWDPYGRIFDSKSLEPIPGITIKTLTQISPVEKLAQIFGNPQTTYEDGAFNFLVEPGTYFLRLVNLPSKYNFSANPNLNQNYAKAYSKRDGTNSIYKPDEKIVEVAGKPEHRDIPLDPGTNPPGHFPVVNIKPYGFNQMLAGFRTQFGGKISHPYSLVSLIGERSQKEIVRVASDKFGLWNVLVVSERIPQDEPLLIKLIKVDLTTMKADEKNARVTKDVYFYPIAQRIQGYVYDRGSVVPNAQVLVNLESNNKIVYQTTSDANGFLSISADHLPGFPYYLTVKTSGKSDVRLTPDTFATSNSQYLTEQKMNLMLADDSLKAPVTQSNSNIVNRSDTSPISLSRRDTRNLSNEQSTQSGSNSMLITQIIASILLLLTISGVIVVVLYKRNNLLVKNK